MKKSLIVAVLMMISIVVRAQEREIMGALVDGDTQEAMSMVTVQLLKMDSTFVAGVVSNSKGRFILKAPTNGRYILKMSSVGYVPAFKNIKVTNDHGLNVGRVSMRADAVMLKGAEITAQALKVSVKEDTFVYNSAAYRTPEGSTIEELVKRLPGAQVDENGKITINGKEVKKILVEGKEFMTGDTKTALKNIPTSIVDRIKSYDQKSDLSRVTGIDDGNEETVLDFGMKPGMNKGTMVNADGAVGTKSRYSSRVFGGYFNSDMRIFGMGNANNVNDMGFGGRGGWYGRGRNGLNATKMAGLNINYEKKNVLKVDGSVRWNHSDGDALSKSSSENFVSTVGSFSNSLNKIFSRSNSWNARARVEWMPDSLTNVMFRPSVSVSTNDQLSSNRSAAFNADPYRYVMDPLAPESIAQLEADNLVVNSRDGNAMSYSDNNNVGAMLQFNRRLNARGRNMTLRADVNYSDNGSKSLSINNVHLYQMNNTMGADSMYQTNRYTVTPTRNWSYTLQATYSEPLWRATFLQLRYQFSHSYSKSDRSTYDFSNLGDNFFSGIATGYRLWDSYLGRLEKDYTHYRDGNLSRYSEYSNNRHDIELMFRMIREKYQLNAGILFQPQRSNYVQDYQGVSVDTVRNVFNVSPTFDFRYRFNKVSNLRLNYRAWTNQPSIGQMLDIYDDSDPLNISTGNPGLKPSFTQNLRFFYNGYFQATQRSVMTHLRFATTSNAISNKVTYDERTGGRTSRPENINGDWSLNGVFMFNTPIDTAGVWNVNTFTNMSYSNNVGYVNLRRKTNADKNTTKDWFVGERLAGSYRKDWLEVELDASLNYRHSRNKLQTTANLDTWRYAYGANVNVTAPWGMAVSTDIHMNSRRGYNDNSLNTNELVWNAQVSQSFLKGKPLTVMLQFYDILQKQSNFSRTISAMLRSDTEYNAINSYVMLHVNYKLNLFGGKAAQGEMRQGMWRGRHGRGGYHGHHGGRF